MRPHLAPPPARPVEPAPPPTFSVIIAAYQAADTVGGAVASALEQTVPPHEVIVCDDGSTDETEDALAPYRERITFLRIEHGGEAAAKNAAAHAATGEFVVILDADDLYLPEMIEALGRLAAARPDLDLLATDAWIERDGRILGLFHDATPFRIDNQRLEILRGNFIMPPAVRRRRWLDVGGFDQTLATHGDWDLWIRLMLEGERAGLVEEPLMRYRLHEHSTSASRPLYARGRLDVLEKTAARDDLDRAERALVEAALRNQRRTALLTDAEEALRRSQGDARRRALTIAVGRDFGVRSRLKASLAALAPGTAARLLERREARTGRSRLRRGAFRSEDARHTAHE